MRARSVGLLSLFGFLSAVLLAGLGASFAAEPAWAGIQGSSGILAACAGFDPSGENSDLVATGTVEEVTTSADSSFARLRLDRVFKGESGRTAEILTGAGSQSGSSVDVAFVDGERYLLYLRRQDAAWTTDVCLGTRPIGDTPPPGVVAALGEGFAPDGSPAMPETGGVPLVPLALTGLAILAAATGTRRRAR